MIMIRHTMPRVAILMQ